MSYHIKEIHLDERFASYKFSDVGSGESSVLRNLSKVNIFVGANNCGKSRFLRLLASTAKLEFVPNLVNKDGKLLLQELAGVRQHFATEIGTLVRSINPPNGNVMVEAVDKLPQFRFLNEGPSSLDSVLNAAEGILNMVRRKEGNIVPFDSTRQMLQPIEIAAQKYKYEAASLSDKGEKNYEFKKLYIPTLRGLRDLTVSKSDNAEPRDFYGERTYEDYFKVTDKARLPEQPSIFTGLALYKSIRSQLLGTWEQRRKIRNFEEFLTNKFFEGRQVELIPKHDDTVLDLRLGGELQRTISQWGDGMQSIIILTFPLFLRKGEKLLIFYEEPELYMHPGLQRSFLSLLTQFPDFKGFQFFLTTHSNHFLDLTLDLSKVSVYSFQKVLEAGKEEQDAQFEIENVSNEDSRTLQLLGVQNSSVFLSNCTIWVEGIMDRQYFRKYLELYQARPEVKIFFKEDLHYSFVEYSGSNITHWSFLDDEGPIVERLCGKLFLIADGDNATGAKAERFQKLKAKLTDRFYALAAKEIENLLSPNVLVEVLSRYGEVSFKTFEQADYLTAPIGKFIEDSVINGERKRDYADKGTLKGKLDFCEKAVAAMDSYDDLSSEAKDVTMRLYEFIAKNNM